MYRIVRRKRNQAGLERMEKQNGRPMARRLYFLRFDYRYDLSESAQSCKPNVHPFGP
jgi:hypothetical protein